MGTVFSPQASSTVSSGKSGLIMCNLQIHHVRATQDRLPATLGR